jgi:arsenite-transporting ATPase
VRVVLFTGKGGAGTTTIAAATALHAARCGLATLLLSDDAGGLLDGRRGRRPGAGPAPLPEGLSLVPAGARASRGRSADVLAEHLSPVLDAVGVDPLTGDELSALPAVERVCALLDIRDLVAGATGDLVVVDGPPPGETVRLLALPEALARCLDAALPVERRLLRAMATSSRGPGAPGRPPHDPLVDAAERLRAELDAVREVLSAVSTSVRLVLTPESAGIADARRALTPLALHGCPVDGVVANRVIGQGDGDPWRAAWALAHSGALTEAERCFRPLPVLRVPYAPAEPTGREALARLGEQLYGPADADGVGALLTAGGPAARMRVRRDTAPSGDADGEEFTLVLPLPLATREDLDLARVDDALSITVAGHHRLLALPSALRRCTVAGARLVDGELRVRFRPDPSLWRSP